MKTKFAFLLVVLLSIGTLLPAQNTNVEKRVRLAREKYPQRLEQIASVKRYEADEIPNINYLTVVRKQNWAGAGQSQDRMEYYYNTIEGEYDTQPRAYVLVMVRRTYNMGSRAFFEEYVYDDDGSPLFWFSKYGYPEEPSVELRGYFAADGTLIKSINKGTEDKEEIKAAYAGAGKQFRLFKKAFQALYEVEYR